MARADRVIAAAVTAAAFLATLAAGASAAAADTARPAADCQPFGSTPCLLPFPNNLFTRLDPRTPTGLRVHLPQGAMPINGKGQRIGVGEYDRNDGFSPGSAMIVHVPGLDNPAAFARTGAVGLLNLGRELTPNQPVVVIDEATRQRQLIYAQLDANAATPATTNLMILPAKELAEGHTFVVALRRLRDRRGRPLKAPRWFEKLRDGRKLPPGVASQQDRYNRMFDALDRAGIRRSGLYEAWDFTVASEPSLTSRLLSIRNSAFAGLGDSDLADGNLTGRAPSYSITSTRTLNPQLRDVQGTVQVPCYLVSCGPTASTPFHYGSRRPDALPTRIPGNTATASFDCIIPTAASPSQPARISLYGHGLFGSRTEVESAPEESLAIGHNMVLCATDWWGLAKGDEIFDAGIVQNLNLFGVLTDRLQQGVLNTLFLGRLMANPRGLAANPAFRSGGSPLIDTSHLYYYGNSQGGIEGGLTTAVSPDVRRSVLGVTGLDYGNLLVQRSIDFAPFKTVLNLSYPDQSLYPVITDLLQQLWDRGDPSGYAEHMTTDPLPDTPSHTVLLQIAYGDFQVSMYAGAAEARTIGASVYQPALDPARARDGGLFYGLPRIGRFPFGGSAVEIWDSGPGRVRPPPVGNLPPTAGPNNQDPHEDPRGTLAAQSQISAFLAPSGTVISVCGGQPCHSSVFTP